MAAGSGFVLVLLSWLGSAILFVFGILCLAAGLFYMAEFVEENTVLTKKSLQKILIGVVVVQVLVGVLSTVSIWPVTLVGLVAHGLYAQLLVTFPYFDLSSPKFIGSAVLLVIHHFVVFSHFSYRYYPFDQVVAYFTVCVWFVPFVLFISLSANEYTLPTSAGMQSAPGSDGMTRDGESRRKGGLLALLQYAKEKVEDLSWA